jgi:hypothetical protein
MGGLLLNSTQTFLEESLLAFGAFFPDSGTHPKVPLSINNEAVLLNTLFQKSVGFSSFL